MPPFFAAGYEAVPSVWLSWVAVAWSAGVVVFWLRLLGGWIIAERLRRRQVRPAPCQWQQAFDGLRARLRVSRPVRLLVSERLRAPAVVGLLRPVVLVPVGALAGLPVEQMEALLLHELAHIRRYDYLVNALQSIVEALLFYHLAVWWVSGHMRSERELCCDDAAVAVTGDAQSYARASGSWGRRARTLPGGDSGDRRFVGVSGGEAIGRAASGRAHAFSGGCRRGDGVGRDHRHGGAWSDRTAGVRSGFHKPAGSQRPGQMRDLPRGLTGRFTMNASLRVLMETAYHLQPFQIVGGPGWIGSEQYEVEAKAAGNPDRARIFLMLQSLLEDRFRLQIHRESREMPVYALVAARRGLKLPPPRPGSCLDEANPLPPLPEPGGRMQPPGQSPASTVRCGGVGVHLVAGGARLTGGKVPMTEFVCTLSRVLGRPVTDQTGFSGVFDVNLDFLPDDTTAGLPAPPPGAIPVETASPSIFGAVQQLGLRLESTKGPIEVLVIDHVERPTAN